MSHYFLDTSAVVKRYITETGTWWIQTLHDPQSGHTRWLVRIMATDRVVYNRARST